MSELVAASRFRQAHFESDAQQAAAGRLGMWLFLATEVLFFGGLFMAFIAFRHVYPETFREARHHLNVPLGTFNTFLLITSSLTMALGVRAAQVGARRQSIGFLLGTLGLGLGFLVVKAFEYHHEITHGMLPGAFYSGEGIPGRPEIFFAVYFAATGLHGLHVIIGLGLIGWLALRAAKGHFSPAYHAPVEGVGLYWHLVDLIWIFLFPVLYLLH